MNKRVLIFTIILLAFLSCFKIEKVISGIKYKQDYNSGCTYSLVENRYLSYIEQDPPQKTPGNRSAGSGGSGSTEGTGSSGEQGGAQGTGNSVSGSTEGTGSTGNNAGEGSATGPSGEIDPSGGTGTNSTDNKSNFELQVEPDRKIIYSGEQTSIQIDLHVVDPEGNEDLSCAGKEVFVKVTGLVDGTISHRSGNITLNEVGVAFINYRAGQRDKQIKIIATYNQGSGTSEGPGTDPTNNDVTSGTNTSDTTPGTPTGDNPGNNTATGDGTSVTNTTDTSPGTPTGDNQGTNPPNPDAKSDNSPTDTSPDKPTGENPGTNPPDPDAISDNSSPDTSPDSPTGDNPGTNPPDPDGTTDNNANDSSPDSPSSNNPGTNQPDQAGTSDNSSTGVSPGQGAGQRPGTSPSNQSGTSGNGENEGTSGYPQMITAEAAINIKPLEYEATLTVKGTYRKTVKSSYRKQTSDGVEDGTHDIQERQEASFYVPLKMENAGDMPVLNQRWEYYRPLDINLSSFNASYRERRYSHGQGDNHGFRTTVTITKSPVGQKVAGKDFLLQSNILLVIDKNTDKVVKVISGYSVEFKWQGSRTMFSEQWSPDSRSSDSDSDPIDEDDTFEAEPVEDPISDPTFSSVSQSLKTYFKDMGIPLPADVEIPEDKDEKPEISPDYLVTTGDGKTFFGGKGEKINDRSKAGNTDREERTFTWHMTRKRKPL
ncbi:MAG TPA: hypothetical protein PK719_08375 [Bacteroidales bacterium]|nr:hypothetical protein [Bacteroidales bacterium]HOU02848.1 hypothetical protein [Bacteroidales bacterium]HQG63661.1 hypothetical protein [Bacteroidales bacterium]HQK69389.1 hypothetical protein [Bacteroidales bacterium]